MTRLRELFDTISRTNSTNYDNAVVLTFDVSDDGVRNDINDILVELGFLKGDENNCIPDNTLVYRGATGADLSGIEERARVKIKKVMLDHGYSGDDQTRFLFSHGKVKAYKNN